MVVAAPTKSIYGNVVSGTVFKEIAEKVYATDIEMARTKDKLENKNMPVSKSGNQDDLKVISYVRRDKEKLEIDPSQKPVSFMITQFHIIFVYQTNITVLSNISQEIVYSRVFDAFAIRKSYFDVLQGNVLV